MRKILSKVDDVLSSVVSIIVSSNENFLSKVVLSAISAYSIGYTVPTFFKKK